MRAVITWSVSVAAMLCAGCGPGRYRIEVTLPDAAAATSVQVRLVESCRDTNRVLESTTVTPGTMAMELGPATRDHYGVHVLVFDAACDVIAEGCVEVTTSGSGGLVQVAPEALDRPTGCGRGDMCECVPASLPDAGPTDAGARDASSPDAGMFDAGDAGSCVDCDGMGMCEDLLTNRSHCGMCGRRCAMMEECVDGDCVR